jgi:hypothetical protein
MSRRTLWALALGVVVAGCSASGPTGFADPTGTSSGGSSGSASSSGSGGSGSGSSGGDDGSAPGSSDASAPLYMDQKAGNSFDTSVPDAAIGQVKTLVLDTFTVAPGAEVYKCQQFANPFGGQPVDLIKMDGTMSAGSHHFFLFNMDPTTGRNVAAPLGDCPGKGIEFHPFPYLSQQPHWVVTYPQPNMGYPLVGANGLMINVHYLNATSAPINAQVQITLYAAKPGVVTTHVGTIFLNQTFMNIPTTATKTAPFLSSASLPIPLSAPFTIFTSWSHMHKWALDFTAGTGPSGNTFYDEKQWDSPPLFIHNPPITMAAATTINWNCSYYNDTGAALGFGDSALTNVMCIYMGQYYPADPTNPDLIEVFP